MCSILLNANALRCLLRHNFAQLIGLSHEGGDEDDEDEPMGEGHPEGLPAVRVGGVDAELHPAVNTRRHLSSGFYTDSATGWATEQP